MSEQSVWCEAHRIGVHPATALGLRRYNLSSVRDECHQLLLTGKSPVAVTDILRSDDSSDSAKLKRAELLGEYFSLFDGAFGDDPRHSSDDLLQELWHLMEDAVA